MPQHLIPDAASILAMESVDQSITDKELSHKWL